MKPGESGYQNLD